MSPREPYPSVLPSETPSYVLLGLLGREYQSADDKRASRRSPKSVSMEGAQCLILTHITKVCRGSST